jgi:hypothetical protein
MQLLNKAREELAHHHSQLVQVSHKYDRSIFRNVKLESICSAAKLELEEFKRKDIENAKAIKQVIFYSLSSHTAVCVMAFDMFGRANSWRVSSSVCSANCKKRC